MKNIILLIGVVLFLAIPAFGQTPTPSPTPAPAGDTWECTINFIANAVLPDQFKVDLDENGQLIVKDPKVILEWQPAPTGGYICTKSTP